MSSKASIRRVYKILNWLKQARPFTTKTLAAELQISARTIREDIDYMKSIGIPVAFDFKQNTYRLTDSFKDLPWQSISGNEVATLLVASLALEALGDSPHALVLSGVVERLSDLLPDTMHLEPDTLSRMVHFDLGGAKRVPLKTMEILHQAIEEQRVVNICYYSASTDKVSERNINPYFLLCTHGRWYLIAYCQIRSDMRDFRVDRIRSLKLHDEVFGIPRDFDSEKYLGPAFGMHRGDRTYPVRVRFSAYQARWIQEEIWHETQQFKRRKDGVLDVSMQVTGLNDVARWVLSYGGEAEVISPPVLRHRVAVEARRMVKVYEG